MSKIKMVSLKEQLSRDGVRMGAKIMARRTKNGLKNRGMFIPLGNKDFGVPYTGKDKFSGQNRKFADRIIWGYETKDEFGEKRVVNRLFVLDNSKYNGDGSLKE